MTSIRSTLMDRVYEIRKESLKNFDLADVIFCDDFVDAIDALSKDQTLKFKDGPLEARNVTLDRLNGMWKTALDQNIPSSDNVSSNVISKIRIAIYETFNPLIEDI